MSPRSATDTPASSVGPRRLAAIAFVDIAGYSVLMAEDETATHASWMNLLDGLLRPQAALYRGKVVKSTGDGVLAEFPSALDAVEWARSVQRAIPMVAAPEAGKPGIALRIAVHLGDVMTTADDIYGDGVNVTARLQEFAEPGGIVISEAVYDLVRGSLGALATDMGLLQLKNFERPVRAYSLAPTLAPALPSARGGQSAVPSIAVLPLFNMGGNADDDYFADGIIEDIIVSLAGLRELLVIARASTLFYGRRQPVDPRAVGRALGVRYVMTGSVRRSARGIHLSVQLCDANSGANLWGHATEVSPGELFDVQDHIVARIVAGIAPHVRTSELRNALRKRPQNFTAYDYTLRALDLINSLKRDEFMHARELLDQAMRADGNFAMAVAWAARWHSLCVGQGWSEDRDRDAAAAAELAQRAVALDQQNALALATYAHVRSFLFHDYDTALVYFDRALAVGPSNSLAWILSSGTLSYVGRGKEAVHNAEHGLRLSPFDQSLFYYYSFLAISHYTAGNYDEAVKWGRLSLSENPNYSGNLRVLAAALAAAGRGAEAREVAIQMTRLEPDFSMTRWERELQPFRDPVIKARYINHLRCARLPP